jgi:hypothetical protein
LSETLVTPALSRRIQSQTTAAAAQAEAKTSDVAHQVENAAEGAQEAAAEAARTAAVCYGQCSQAWQSADPIQEKGPSLTGEPSALNQLQREFKSTTDAAAVEGKRDVNAAANQGAGYVDQAKALASDAAATIQVCRIPQIIQSPAMTDTFKSYLPESVANVGKGSNAGDVAANIAGQVQAGASVAYQNASDLLSAAQQAAQPHIDKAKEYAGSFTNNAKDGNQ